MTISICRGSSAGRLFSLLLAVIVLAPRGAAGAESTSAVVHRVRQANQRMEMMVSTSRILTLDSKIPQAQVNNPDILELTPLSPTEIQVFAKKPGVTQVNLWDEKKNIYTIDMVVYGDVRELEGVLRDAFPRASLQLRQVSNSVMISGYVDDPNDVSTIVQIAEEYYPKIVNNMKIGGVQQVLLHIQVMEVSRTKLRELGVDWAQASNGSIVSQGITGLLSDFTPDDLISPPGILWRTTNPSTFAFGIVSGNNAFFGVLDALRQNNLMKIMSEPTIVCVNGRPSKFHVGGSFTVISEGLGGGTIKEIEYGTTVDFVPIILGNGKLRLEVRPEVSDIDHSLTVQGIPGLKNRGVDTAVVMMAGQTMAIGGLIQTRVESENRGIPWISDVPYLGVPFRKVKETMNEVELLIMVTPELVEAIDADQMPPCGPGMNTDSPNDWELYMRGYLEVPKCCPDGCAGGPMMAPGMPGMILDGSPEVLGAPTPAVPVPELQMPVPDSSTGVHRPSSTKPVSFQRQYNRPNPQSRTAASTPPAEDGLPGFIGATGYDAKR